MSFIVELPGVYLDGAQFGVATGLTLINQDPQPAETGVLVHSDIALHIASLTGNNIDNTDTQVFVNINSAGEVLAYNNGTFQVGFNGPRSTFALSNNTLRIVIDVVAPFSSEDTVDVRVVSQDVGATQTIDTTYSFTAQDLTPGLVTSASPQNFKIIRITFAEAMKQTNKDDGDDALNPLNYAFTPLTFPAVTPVAKSVESVSSTAVDVTVDIEFSYAKDYRVTVSGVADLNGNLT